MKPVRLLCAAILALTGLVAVGLTTEAANAASSKDLTVSYSQVMRSETFFAYGELSTNAVRTVKLQYRNTSSGPWTTKSSTTSDSDGYFGFSPSTTKTRYWRYYAPASGSLGSIKGNPRKVTVVAQKVSIDVVRKTQCHFGANPTNDVTVTFDFYPNRVGRQVNFGSSAIDTNDYQDSSGKVSFRFNPGTTNGTFDAAATAEGFYGASSFATPVVHYSITSCQLL
jgi:hypothetical protein